MTSHEQGHTNMPGEPMNDRRSHEPQLGNLDYSEQLLVWSTRKWLEDGTTSPPIERAFLDAFRVARVEAALAGFEGVVEILATAGRRVLGLRRPHCGRVSADEMSILALIAAVQAGDDDHAEALARWLVPAARGQRLIGHATALAVALRECGLLVPRRTAPMAPPAGGKEPATGGPTFQQRI
jgi:hypothetical protein